jgi:hypothetical protein
MRWLRYAERHDEQVRTGVFLMALCRYTHHLPKQRYTIDLLPAGRLAMPTCRQLKRSSRDDAAAADRDIGIRSES